MVTPPLHDGAVLSSTEGWAEGKELVLAYQAGDTAAYDAIYEKYSARVNGICRRMLLDPHDVQEASQEAFLRVYQALGRFNGRYELGAWIARITTNVCLDNLRAKGRRPKEIAPLETIDLDSALESEPETPETAVIRRAEGRRVRKVLASLPPLHRAAIVLRDFEGLSYAEIAGALKITEPQVKALLHRARGRFKRDWSSLASIFLPARLLQRFRDMPAASMEQAAYGTTSAPQLAASCSAILHQCGQILAERVGPALAGASLAVAGIGASTAATANEAPVKVVDAAHESVALRMAGKQPVDTKGMTRKKNDRKTKDARDGSEAVVPVPAASPSPTPEPSPSAPGSTEGESGGSTPPEQGNNQPPSTPTPPPFAPALGFGTPRSAPARSHSSSMDCAATTFEQSLATTMAHGDKTYFAALDLDGDSHSADFELVVYPDSATDASGATVTYDGDATLASFTRSGSRLLLEYSGYYTNTDAPDAEWKELPESGTFRIRLELDCTASSVITETVQLSTE